MYQELQPARSEFVPIRQLNYHVRLWGPATSDLPPLVLVWMPVLLLLLLLPQVLLVLPLQQHLWS